MQHRGGHIEGLEGLEGLVTCPDPAEAGEGTGSGGLALSVKGSRSL